MTDQNQPPQSQDHQAAKPAPSIQIQSILYHMDIASIERALTSVERAVDLAIGGGVCSRITVFYGDTSSQRCLTDGQLADLKARFSWAFELKYYFFNENLGSARGHNLLAQSADSDYLLILNPDVIVSPRLFEAMLEPFVLESTGMVEAKQLPIEHPKDYDPLTGETGWATTACALTQRKLFEELGGFDSDSFFLYCDDVDYSWRVREAGYKVIFAPHAVVFHDKRVANDGGWQPSGAERRFSAEAALMMAHKWSRPDLVQAISASHSRGGAEARAALAAYEAKRKAGKLAAPRDADHKIGEFVGHFYAKHRYAL